MSGWQFSAGGLEVPVVIKKAGCHFTVFSGKVHSSLALSSEAVNYQRTAREIRVLVPVSFREALDGAVVLGSTVTGSHD